VVTVRQGGRYALGSKPRATTISSYRADIVGTDYRDKRLPETRSESLPRKAIKGGYTEAYKLDSSSRSKTYTLRREV